MAGAQFTLGRFEVQINGETLEFSRKLPRKTLLLLKAIVALGGTGRAGAVAVRYPLGGRRR